MLRGARSNAGDSYAESTQLACDRLSGMRKQYHFRPGPGGLDAWDVDRLIILVEHQPVEQIPLSDFAEIDTGYWFDHGNNSPTARSVAGHFRLMIDADLQCPIVLNPDGGVMDGMHRVARALAEGRSTVLAKRLPVMPEPDFRDCHPDDLPY